VSLPQGLAVPRRQRDYAAEYRRRIERGLAAGKTRQEARGHREELRQPSGESGYSVRQHRSIARRLREGYNAQRNASQGYAVMTRAESLQLAYKLTGRWGLPATRRLLDQVDVSRHLYVVHDLDAAEEAADDAGKQYDELNERYEDAEELAGSDYEDWDDYVEIDFGDPPDYAICLFYH
jgi:hypothetical protein